MEDMTEGKGESENEESDFGGSSQSDSSVKEKEDNSCVQIYLQANTHDRQTRYIFDFLGHVMDEKMFDQVRNKDQFGYYVSAATRLSFGITGFLFTIQSGEHSPIACEKRIFKFMLDFFNTTFTEECYTEFLAGFLAKKRNGFTNQRDEWKYLVNEHKSNYLTSMP